MRKGRGGRGSKRDKEGAGQALNVMGKGALLGDENDRER